MPSDPLDRIAEICHDQQPDALSRIAAVLGVEGGEVKYVCRHYLANSRQGAFEQYHEPGRGCRVVTVRVVDAPVDWAPRESEMATHHVTCPKCNPEMDDPDVVRGYAGTLKYMLLGRTCRNCGTELVDLGPIKAPPEIERLQVAIYAIRRMAEAGCRPSDIVNTCEETLPEGDEIEQDENAL